MFGLDEHIAELGSGEVFAVVALVAALLGFRHAADPDHVMAVSTLTASDAPDPRRAGRLGLGWGLGHATTLLALGVPAVLVGRFLPSAVEGAAEFAIGVVIAALAIRLLVRWRGGHLQEAAAPPVRTALQAYGIGLLHGAGGSASVVLLLTAAIPDHAQAILALTIFAAATAASMALASAAIGLTLTRTGALSTTSRALPALAAASLAFGTWYAVTAMHALRAAA